MCIEEMIARLGAVDACAVSDAMDSLDLVGAVEGIERRATKARIAGRVKTLRLTDIEPPHGTRVHLGATSIVTADPGDVIVVEQRTGLIAAGWGGVLSNAAKAAGVTGVIVEGPARDIDECEAIGFPLFARIATTRTARGRVYEAETGGRIRVGDVDVVAGDFVIADGSGIVFVPAGSIGEVIDKAERIRDRERLMTAEVLDGRPVTEVMGADYETMLRGRR